MIQCPQMRVHRTVHRNIVVPHALSQVHLTRLVAFAEAYAPSMLATLPTAFARYAERPEILWAAIEQRFPCPSDSTHVNTVDKSYVDDGSVANVSVAASFFVDVLALQEARTETRAKMAALLAAAHLREDDEYSELTSLIPTTSPPSANLSGSLTHNQQQEVTRKAHIQVQQNDTVSTNKEMQQTPSPREFIATHGSDDSRNVLKQPSVSTVSNLTSPLRATADQILMSDPLVATKGIVARFASTLSCSKATGLFLLLNCSAYVPPQQLVISRQGKVLGYLPRANPDEPRNDTRSFPAQQIDQTHVAFVGPVPGDASVIAMTLEVPPLPSLSEAAKNLTLLSVSQLALLAAVHDPEPCLVVVFGVICVLIGAPTNWRAALDAVADPDLVIKLLRLANYSQTHVMSIDVVSPLVGPLMSVEDSTAPESLLTEGIDAARSIECVEGSNDSVYTQLTASGVVFSADRLSTADNARARRAHATMDMNTDGRSDADSAVAMATKGDPIASLRLMTPAVTLCRRMLNRRPDIRAEVRALTVSVGMCTELTGSPTHGSRGTDDDSMITLPLAALVALCDFLVVLILRASIRHGVPAEGLQHAENDDHTGGVDAGAEIC